MSLKNLKKSKNSISPINTVNLDLQFANLNLPSLNANLLNTKLFSKFVNLNSQFINRNLLNYELFSKFSKFSNLKSATNRIKLYIYIYISVYSSKFYKKLFSKIFK